MSYLNRLILNLEKFFTKLIEIYNNLTFAVSNLVFLTMLYQSQLYFLFSI